MECRRSLGGPSPVNCRTSRRRALFLTTTLPHRVLPDRWRRCDFAIFEMSHEAMDPDRHRRHFGAWRAGMAETPQRRPSASRPIGHRVSGRIPSAPRRCRLGVRPTGGHPRCGEAALWRKCVSAPSGSRSVAFRAPVAAIESAGRLDVSGFTEGAATRSYAVSVGRRREPNFDRNCSSPTFGEVFMSRSWFVALSAVSIVGGASIAYSQCGRAHFGGGYGQFASPGYGAPYTPGGYYYGPYGHPSGGFGSPGCGPQRGGGFSRSPIGPYGTPGPGTPMGSGSRTYELTPTQPQYAPPTTYEGGTSEGSGSRSLAPTSPPWQGSGSRNAPVPQGSGSR